MEVWGQKINDFFREELILASFFTDRSDELKDGGDTVHTPGLTAMAASSKSVNSEVTLVSPTETSVPLVVATWEEVSFIIEDREAAQVRKSYSLQERYAKNAAFSVAKTLETAIAALFSGFSQSVGASTTNIVDSDIRKAIALMEAVNVPVYNGESAFFLHPNTFWTQVQALDRFALAVNSPSNDPTGNRPKATLYGIPVHVTPNVPYVSSTTGRVNLLANKDAIHWAKLALPETGKSVIGSEGVRVQSNYVPQYLGTLTTADLCFGVIENRDTAAIQLLTHATTA